MKVMLFAMFLVMGATLLFLIFFVPDIIIELRNMKRGDYD